MRITSVILAAFVSVFLASGVDARVKIKEACSADLDKFCQDAKKGGRIACLRSHASELQPGCADALKQRDAEKGKQPS